MKHGGMPIIAVFARGTTRNISTGPFSDFDLTVLCWNKEMIRHGGCPALSFLEGGSCKVEQGVLDHEVPFQDFDLTVLKDGTRDVNY